MIQVLLVLAALAVGGRLLPSPGAQASDDSTTLWYQQPAKQWTEALPIGNGRLAGMVFGGITNEHLQFNESTLWTGKPHEYQHEGAAKFLPQIRQLLLNGKQKEAEALATKEFMSVPMRQMAYQPFGDVHLFFPGHTNATNYRRELNLDTAVATVSYQCGDVNYTREIFATHPDQVIAWKITGSKPGTLIFTVTMDSTQLYHTAATAKDGLLIRGKTQERGVKFEARLGIVAMGGKVEEKAGRIALDHATSAVLVLVAATSFRNYQDINADPSKLCEAIAAKVRKKDFEPMLEAHLADHQKLFRRVQLDLGSTPSAKLPTDQRLKNVAKQPDPDLAALYFQF